MSATKISENTINLHFVKSNQISTYRKLTLPLTGFIYVALPLEMQKRLKQTKLYHSFSYFVWRETTRKTLKVAVAKTLFSSVYIIGTSCFDECFLFYVITERHYFSWKFIITLRLLKRHVAAFFEAILCVISTITIWC